MSNHEADPSASPLARKLGFWAAITAFLTFVVYTICFIAIFLTSPLFTWTTLADYVAYIGEYGLGTLVPRGQSREIILHERSNGVR